MNPNEPFELHFILFNINGGDPYKDGYCGFYHGKLILPETYPFKPPTIMMMTPSGRFQTNTPISTSFSNFDPDNWNPALGIYNTLECLIEFMGDCLEFSWKLTKLLTVAWSGQGYRGSSWL